MTSPRGRGSHALWVPSSLARLGAISIRVEPREGIARLGVGCAIGSRGSARTWAKQEHVRWHAEGSGLRARMRGPSLGQLCPRPNLAAELSSRRDSFAGSAIADGEPVKVGFWTLASMNCDVQQAQ